MDKRLTELLAQKEKQTGPCNMCNDTGLLEGQEHYLAYGVGPNFCECDIGLKELYKWKGQDDNILTFHEHHISKYEDQISQCRIPDKYKYLFVEKLDNKGIAKEFDNCLEYKNMKKFIAKGRGYYLRGQPGTGKTHAMMTLYSEIIRRFGLGVQYINLPSLVSQTKAEMTYDDKETDRIRTRAIRAEVLCVDDAGVEKGSDYVTEMIYNLINKRYENKLTTIFTSNQSLADLEKHYNQQIASRIQEMCKVIKFTGTDKRKDLRPDF